MFEIDKKENIFAKDLEDKISNKDEFIKADNLYGLFVSNNTFIIAKGTTKKHKYLLKIKIKVHYFLQL